MILELTFWILIGLVVYAYFGYTLLLTLIYLLRKIFTKRKEKQLPEDLPHVTLFVTAFNEKEIIADKVKNSLNLNYPKEKLELVWVTDGSDDGSEELLKSFPEVKVFHENQRKGKIHAMQRGIQFVNSPIVIFCDANTMLAEESVLEVVKLLSQEDVGCVAGEKRIWVNHNDKAVGAGEGAYWKYESFIKKMESEVNSTMGAAGELFAIKRALFDPIKEDSILDDFTISLNIAKKGFKIKYAPKATAFERSSLNINEEMKRKVRIANGGFQTTFRMMGLLNVFKHGFLSVQYVSHKILRWFLVPLALPVILLLNLSLQFTFPLSQLYTLLIFAQLGFYFFAFIGWALRNKKIKQKVLFVPYYLCMMNYCIILGLFKYLEGRNNVVWEKAQRAG